MMIALLYLAIGSLFYAAILKSAMPVGVPRTAEILYLPFVEVRKAA